MYILSSKLVLAQVKIAQIFHYFLHNLIVLSFCRSSHMCLTAASETLTDLSETRAVVRHAWWLTCLWLPAARAPLQDMPTLVKAVGDCTTQPVGSASMVRTLAEVITCCTAFVIALDSAVQAHLVLNLLI